MTYCRIDDAYNLLHDDKNCVYDTILKENNEFDTECAIGCDNDVFTTQGELVKSIPKYNTHNGTEIASLIKTSSFEQNDYDTPTNFAPSPNKTKCDSSDQIKEITKKEITNKEIINKETFDVPKKIKDVVNNTSSKLHETNLSEEMQKNILIILIGILIIFIIDFMIRIGRHL